MERDIMKTNDELIDWVMPEDDPVNPFRCSDPLPECVERVEPGKAVIGSRGDPKNKILCVEQGRLKLEGPHGQWLLLPAHMVFIPHSRPYRLYTSADAVIVVGHLGAQHTVWQHEGCWAAPVSGLAREIFGYALRWGRDPSPHPPPPTPFFPTLCLLSKYLSQRSHIITISFS